MSVSNTTFFNTHDAFKTLIAAGVPEKQAEAQTRIISDIIEKDLVTKEHLNFKMAELDIRFKELEVKIAQSETRIILKICALLIAQSGIIVALIKLL